MNKISGLSRGTEIDTPQCVDLSGGNRFNLVLIAAARAREIKRQHRESDKREHVYSNLTALLEIQEGKVGVEYLKRVR
jgi:DNA-directed RNA polymerase subunit K/omega